MTRQKGLVLALTGFLILVASLVLSTPVPGHGEGRREAPVLMRSEGHSGEAARSPQLPAMAFPPAGAAREADHVAVVQETGPILFKGEELEAFLTFPVPLGKRLVVESVSVRAVVSPGQRVSALFTTTALGGTATHVVPLIPQGQFPRQGEVFVGAPPLRAYADGGTVVHFRVDRTAAGESDTGTISITGYLE